MSAEHMSRHTPASVYTDGFGGKLKPVPVYTDGFGGKSKPVPVYTSGFDTMGKPIPLHRKSAAYDLVKSMGIGTAYERTALVNGVAEKLERDQPYEAQSFAMKYLDLTGTYRLFVYLLCDPA